MHFVRVDWSARDFACPWCVINERYVVPARHHNMTGQLSVKLLCVPDMLMILVGCTYVVICCACTTSICKSCNAPHPFPLAGFINNPVAKGLTPHHPILADFIAIAELFIDLVSGTLQF